VVKKFINSYNKYVKDKDEQLLQIVVEVEPKLRKRAGKG